MEGFAAYTVSGPQLLWPGAFPFTPLCAWLMDGEDRVFRRWHSRLASPPSVIRPPITLASIFSRSSVSARILACSRLMYVSYRVFCSERNVSVRTQKPKINDLDVTTYLCHTENIFFFWHRFYILRTYKYKTWHDIIYCTNNNILIYLLNYYVITK